MDALRTTLAEDSGGKDKLEVRQLRQTVRDLVTLAAMPVAWIGQTQQQIAKGVADLLIGTLLTDTVYVKLNHPEEAPSEICHSEACPEFAEWLGQPETKTRTASAVPAQRRAKLPVKDGFLHIAIVPIGPDAEGGLIVVGSYHSDFPTDLETALLSVATTQVLISFLGAQAVSEGKRTGRLPQALRDNVNGTPMFEEIVGTSPALHRVLALVKSWHRLISIERYGRIKLSQAAMRRGSTIRRAVIAPKMKPPTCAM